MVLFIFLAHHSFGASGKFAVEVGSVCFPLLTSSYDVSLKFYMDALMLCTGASFHWLIVFHSVLYEFTFELKAYNLTQLSFM